MLLMFAKIFWVLWLGQQQLLLIVLGIIIVGVAVMLGINVFRQNAIDQKRDIVTNECVNLASMAQSYFRRPKSYGGGENSFIGWDVPSELHVTASGTYIAAVYADSVVITGTGNEVTTGNDSVRVETSVYPNSFVTRIIN